MPLPVGQTGSTLEVNGSDVELPMMTAGGEEEREHAHPSAYIPASHLRPQAMPHHSSGGQREKRGDLTADNLERIPDADHVAPGIRLETVGNDYHAERNRMGGEARQQAAPTREGNEKVGDGDDRTGSMMVLDDDGGGEQDGGSRADNRNSLIGGRAPSSMDMSGRSSTGAIDQESEHFHDADDGDVEFDDDDKSPDVIHERVGGSGATSENASKGTSVGHFGPRGEAIPGVPPHLDPRQPHFRPPSPSAASVLSVAVQPPASPKVHAANGSGGPSGLSGTGPLGAMPIDVIDSGEETESFDNGALTPTLSDEFVEDDAEDRLKSPSEQDGIPSSKAGPTFSLQRMDIESDGAIPSSSSSGPYQVSFSPIVTSHHRGSVSSYSGRAPSIAATAGSSRAPSARGLSPPASTSRAGTTEGSSVEGYESIGTGLCGDDGAETPSVGRSRRSSSSAPSSEPTGEDVNNRARGSTLVPSTQPGVNLAIAASSYGGSVQGHGPEEDGPSLAPSEAGSDSTRSMTYESSLGHGAFLAGAPYGQGNTAIASSERLPSGWSSAAVASSPVVLEPSASGSLNDHPVDPFSAAVNPGVAATASGSLASTSSFKSPLSAPPPMLPSLLAIKNASRRQGSGPASTTATAGTASPPSSISIDGDFDDSSNAVDTQQSPAEVYAQASS